MKIGILGGASWWKHWKKPYAEIKQDTPYGEMSDVICVGKIGRHEIYTLQRHGKKYEHTLQDIPWQANVYGMFEQKIDFLIHVTASGALSAGYKAGDIVLFDQLIDFTKQRPVSMGRPALEKVTYMDFSRPISDALVRLAMAILHEQEFEFKVGGTMLSEEGPKFSSIAESKMYKTIGADFVNQSSCPEVLFCREMSIPVLALTMITNCIEFDKPILAEEIAQSIVEYKDKMPKLVQCLLENLPESIDFEKIDRSPYNVTKFDLREDAKK